MADIQRSRSLKRPSSSQSGRPKRVAMPNRFSDSHTLNTMNTLNSLNTMSTLSTSPRPQLTVDLASSPSYVGAVPMTSSRTSSSYTGSYTPYGGVSMAQAPSQMSNLSYQLSVESSPTSCHLLPRQPLPYWSDIRVGPSPDEDGLLMDPATYLQSNNLDSSSSGSGSPYSLPRECFLGADLSVAAAAGSNSFGAMTDATSISYDQSVGVQAGLFNAISIDAPDMVQIQSQQAFDDFAPDFLSLEHIKHDASADDCVRGAGSMHMHIPTQWDAPFGGFDMERTVTAASRLSFAQGQSLSQSETHYQSQGTISVDDWQALSAPAMERSASSGRSNQSARMREAARRHLLNADKNQIQPKNMPLSSGKAHPATAGSVPPLVSPSKSSVSFASSMSTASSAGKMKISKTQRERPAHQRLFCTHCSKHDAGFRGPHELQRHISRHHNIQRKRYICVDPRVDGTDSLLMVFKPLETCKKCRDKKQYGADYNAAAHLRRAHFKERMPRTKGRSQPAQDDTSSFPAMETLKHWIKEVTVSVSSDSSVASVRGSPASASENTAQYMDLVTVLRDVGEMADADTDADADADEQDPEQSFYDDSFVFPPSHEQYSLQSQTEDLGPSAVPRQSPDTMFSFDEGFSMLNNCSRALLHLHGQADGIDSQEALFPF
ncbi:key lime pathogenicity protein [Ophiostoma piceae UAMH 11346]|uniref:Key lime pathogenicity protein n=1 Tax=Ophiostoma piceae (strain UAMH 11346) TaxID=1262450 RepID=S3BRJ1_OPHP1|nr:key lime pathogenicity protein [Ophiostoma piceae UAMH 11346]